MTIEYSNIILEERYTKTEGETQQLINFIIYKSTTLSGNDEVLQHKLHGIETAHITLHPDGSVNYRPDKRFATEYLKKLISNNFVGLVPSPSSHLREFLNKIQGKI